MPRLRIREGSKHPNSIQSSPGNQATEVDADKARSEIRDLLQGVRPRLCFGIGMGSLE